MEATEMSTAASRSPTQDHGTAHRPDIQGLRAVAVGLVVAFHAGLSIPGGFVGVDIFFVISGYVITAMLRREHASNGRLDLRRFYERRFKRLVPALSLMVATTMLIAALVLSPTGTQQVAAKTAVGTMLIAGNWVIAATTGGYFDAPALANPLLNTWSLAVEEQFYLLFPLALAFCWARPARSRFARHAAPAFVGLVALLSFGLAVYGSIDHSAATSWWLGFYSPLTRAWEFAVGALIAFAGARLTAGAGRAAVAAFAGSALLLVSLALISDTQPFPGLWTLLPVAAAGLLIVAGASPVNPVSKLLSSRPLVSMGNWSYSIYLWHWPLIVFARTLWPQGPVMVLPAIALAFAISILSYYGVEDPIRRAPRRLFARQIGMAALTLAPPLLLALLLGVASSRFFGQEQLLARIVSLKTAPTGWGHPLCISRVPVDRRDTKACQWVQQGKGVPVYLIGDSNAVQFSEALQAAGSTLERPVTVLGSEGCPLIDVFLRRKSDPSLMAQCRADYLALMTWLKAQPAGLVMIASVDRYWRDPDYLVGVDAELTRAAFEANVQTLNQGLTRTIRELMRAGHAVTLIQTIPAFVTAPYNIERTVCSGWSVLAGDCQAPHAEMPRSFADTFQAASRRSLWAVAAETGARVVDFRDFFCPQAVCTTRVKGGQDAYMLDGYHLNATGSRLLKDEFIKELTALPAAGCAWRRPDADGPLPPQGSPSCKP